MFWTFRDFLDGAGDNEIRRWLDSIPKEAMIKIETRLLYLAPLLVWPPQYVSALTGWPGLYELRVIWAGNQYRPLGFKGPWEHDFTLVDGEMEKGKLPKRVLARATERMHLVKADRKGRSCEHTFRTNRPTG